MVRLWLHAATLFLASVCLAPATALAADLEPSAFFGSYIGSAVSETDADVSKRDIAVEIKAYKNNGFTLSWTTITKRASGKLKRKAYTVNFVPTNKEGVFASAMRTNLFGKAVPMDPLKGDPYVWATIEGPTLTVHAMVITEDHGYEMQTYVRTRTKTGIDLTFHRVRNGERLIDVTGTLVRTEG